MDHSVLVCLQLVPLVIVGAVFAGTLRLGARPPAPRQSGRPPEAKM